MKKIIIYAAISLDGYIAKADGSVEWLNELPNPEKLDYGYHAFYDTIDTTIMGNKTYQQVLGFDIPFPYKGKKNYVLTRDESLSKDENVEFVSKNLVERLKNLKQEKGKNIWLVGGGEINTLLMNEGLLDELMLFVMPIVLGSGIRLFNESLKASMLDLKETKNYNTGVVEMLYRLKKN